MAEQVKLDPAKLHLIRIDVKAFNIFAENVSLKSIPVTDIEVQIESYQGSNIDKKAIGYGLRISVWIDRQKEVNTPNIFADIFCHFIVENFTDFIVEKKKNNIIISGELGDTLAALTYSTSRGIIFEKTNGTVMQGYLLPILNPVAINDDLIK